MSRIHELVEYLNKCRDSYYNKNKSIISDQEYDRLFDELESLERQTGIILNNSPTQTVGYEVVSSLPKVTHIRPLLSMNKTRSVDDVVSFVSGQSVLMMHKCDGLTCQLTYDNGELVLAETRGDGIVGENITHTARTFLNVPKVVSKKERFVITGEAVISREDFLEINHELGDVYKNPRNLASGSVRQLDSNICAKRKVRFIVWNANDLSTDGTMYSGLEQATNLGFVTVDRILYTSGTITSKDVVERDLNNLRAYSSNPNVHIPIDGIVIIYNDIEYGKSLGMTSHHYNNSVAYKFYDETYETTITDIDYTIGKTGVLTPTAVFDAVDIDGTTVTRASVHNISILRTFNICPGDIVTVYKANQIIPQIRTNNTVHADREAFMSYVPKVCPCCGVNTVIEKNDDVEVLICGNKENCSGVMLKKFSTFVSKSAMNIDGLSEKTLEKLIQLKVLKTYKDIFTGIERCKDSLRCISGFGDRSVQSMIDNINKARVTTLDRLLIALSIEGVGKQNATIISELFDNNPNELLQEIETNKSSVRQKIIAVKGLGDSVADSFLKWFDIEENKEEYKALLCELSFGVVEKKAASVKLKGLNFVITGSLHIYKRRDDLTTYIQSNGGNVQGAVTKDTTYLINNDVTSNSSKNKKAKELGISIISEEQFVEMFGEDTPQKSESTPKKGKLF